MLSIQMKFRPLIVMALAMATVPLLASQEAGKAKQDPAAKPVAASAVVVQPVSVPLTGLTQDGVQKVQTALTALKHPMWCCPGCKDMQEEKGTCAACKKDLVSESLPVLGSVTADATKATLTFALHEGMRLKLSELDRALAAGSAKVDQAKLTLGSNAVLYIQGPGAAEDAKKLESELRASKLFASMDFQHKADSRDYHILVNAGEKPVSHGDLAKAVEKVGSGFKLTDVAWNAPKRLG